MRRLPFYFLIDISESMVGEPIRQVEEGLAAIIKELKTDPYALETAWVSIIVFAGRAKTLVPLQEIVNFYPPRFPVGSGTSLSNGLGHLMFELRSNLVKTTPERKGDWKPIIFLFTDGAPTDNTLPAIAEWKKNWKQSANLVAISIGNNSDLKLLGELTENVLALDDTRTGAYKEFFKWVSASIKTNSINVESNSAGFELAKIESDVISKINLTKQVPHQQVDSNYVVLSGKCQNTKRPYLIKYKRTITPAGISDFNTLSYKLVGAFEVENSYFELSGEAGTRQKINTEELVGAPTCPSCGNQFGFAICGCGGLHCIGDEEASTCPWCGKTGTYGVGESGFDVNRTQG